MSIKTEKNLEDSFIPISHWLVIEINIVFLLDNFKGHLSPLLIYLGAFCENLSGLKTGNVRISKGSVFFSEFATPNI